jgi:6-phosphogluconolactonase (cycloisomerase 2 family)
MRLLIRFASVAGVATAAAVAFAAPAAAAPSTAESGGGGQRADDGHAVFVQTDNPRGNQVVAYHRGRGGALTLRARYPTGGLGGVLGGSVVDHLASQGSLGYDARHRLLFAVNAGSDTVSVFAVRGDRLALRQVIGSGGSFPVSVTVHGELVYVLNAEDGGSLQGYRLEDGRLEPVRSWHRGLGLDPTALPQFTHTPGQVAFTPHGDRLVVTTKANGNAIEVFAVRRSGAPSSAPTVTVLPGAVPFAVAFDPAGHLAVSNAGTNAVSTFTINPDRTLTQLDSAATGQAATCWIVAAQHRLYASNAGSATVSGYRSSRTGALTALGNTATDPGTVDAAVSSDQHFLYVQTGANGILDGYRIQPDGSLRQIGSVTVAGSVGGEGIIAL